MYAGGNELIIIQGKYFYRSEIAIRSSSEVKNASLKGDNVLPMPDFKSIAVTICYINILKPFPACIYIQQLENPHRGPQRWLSF